MDTTSVLAVVARLSFTALESRQMDLVKHIYLLEIIVPAVSGDGWSKYPDYSAEEIGRATRRALHNSIEGAIVTAVTFTSTEKV